MAAIDIIGAGGGGISNVTGTSPVVVTIVGTARNVSLDQTQFKTINGNSIFGAGNIVISTGLTNWTEAFNSGTQATSSFTALNAAANVNAAITPKGTGALVAQIPTGTTVGGNARGQYAVDFQMHRNNANQVASGDYSVIAGGINNRASGNNSFVGAGASLLASGNNSGIVSGTSNAASGNNSFIGGGQSSTASGADSFIGGGNTNTVSGQYGTIGGGQLNTASGSNWATVGGGYGNTASFNGGVVAGGYQNNCGAFYSGIASGESNTIGISGDGYAFIGGGVSNVNSAGKASILGGQNNSITASSQFSSIGGGFTNVILNSTYSQIGGGRQNSINPGAGNSNEYNTIAGGRLNSANGNNGSYVFIGGGANNIASGAYSFIGGGYQGVATLQAQQVYSGGAFSTAGDAQAHELIWRRQITGTAQTELFLDGASLAAILPSTNTLWQGTIEIAAICTVVGNGTTTLGDAQGTSYKVTIKRLGATTALVGTVQEIGTTNADPSALGVFTIDANNTNESLRIQFTPPPSAGSTTVHRVVATFRGLQIQY